MQTYINRPFTMREVVMGYEVTQPLWIMAKNRFLGENEGKMSYPHELSNILELNC